MKRTPQPQWETLQIPEDILADIRRIYPNWMRLHAMLYDGVYEPVGRLLNNASMVMDAPNRRERRDLSWRWLVLVDDWRVGR